MIKFIYVIQSKKRFKIGVANDSKQRLRTLQTGNADKLDLIMNSMSTNAREVEAKIHRKLGHKRISGEWFELDKQDLNWLSLLLYNENTKYNLLTIQEALESITEGVNVITKDRVLLDRLLNKYV